MIKTLADQMILIANILSRLGYKELVTDALDANNWEFACDFVNIIKEEAKLRQDDSIMDELRSIFVTA